MVTARLLSALERRPLLVAVLVFTFALAWRLAFLLETRQWPIFNTFIPGLDDQMAWEGARLLRDPSVTGPRFELMALSAPLHVELTALLQAALGERVGAHRLLWTLVHAGRFPLIFLLGRRLGASTMAAAVATVLLAAVPALVLADTTVGKAALAVTLLTLLLFVVIRPSEAPPSRGKAIGLGILAGGLSALAFLDQLLTVLYAVPVLLFLARHPGWPRPVRALACGFAALVSVGVLLLFLARPASLTDAEARHLPRAGVDLKIGMTTTDGAYHPPPGVTANIIGHTFEARMLAELRAGRPLSQAEFDRQERTEAWRYLRNNPLAVAAGLLPKLTAFLGNHEPASELSLGVLRRMTLSLRLLPVGFAVLLATGLAGLIALWSKRPQAALLLAGLWLCVLLPVLGGHVSWRYRLPAYVPLALLSAPGLAWIRQAMRQRRVAPLLAVLAVAAFSLLPPAQKVVTTAETNMIRNLRGADIARRDAAMLERQGDRDPVLRIKLLGQLGRHTRCRLEAARLAADPGAHPSVAARHLKYLLWQGEYGQARLFLSQLRSQAPDGFGPVVSHSSLNGAERAALRRFVLEPLLGTSRSSGERS